MSAMAQPFGGLGTRTAYLPAKQTPMAVPPARPVAPVRLPPAHTWHPMPPVAFHIPKEPAMKSSQVSGRTAHAVAKVSVPKAKLRSSYGRMQR